jgi:hypothetical protein
LIADHAITGKADLLWRQPHPDLRIRLDPDGREPLRPDRRHLLARLKPGDVARQTAFELRQHRLQLGVDLRREGDPPPEEIDADPVGPAIIRPDPRLRFPLRRQTQIDPGPDHDRSVRGFPLDDLADILRTDGCMHRHGEDQRAAFARNTDRTTLNGTDQPARYVGQQPAFGLDAGLLRFVDPLKQCGDFRIDRLFEKA